MWRFLGRAVECSDLYPRKLTLAGKHVGMATTAGWEGEMWVDV